MFKSICLPKSNQLMVYIDNIQLIIGGGGNPKTFQPKVKFVSTSRLGIILIYISADEYLKSVGGKFLYQK